MTGPTVAPVPVPIGGTDVRVTDLGFGGASLGNLYRATTEEEGRAAVAAAYDAGIRYFDTAPHYGLGLSELRLGRALADYPRATFTVSTKVGRALDPHPAPTGSDLAAGGFDVPDALVRRWDFSAAGVRRSLEESRERLGLDRIDIVYVHDPDDHADQAIAEAIPALVELRDSGVIGAVGIGMNQVAVPLRAVLETDLDVVMLANRWTLLDRSGQELVDTCAERGVSVVAAAPFNSGLLARPRPTADAMYDYQPASAELLARVNGLADVCERWGVTLPDAAVQFPLRHPAVVSVVAGLRDPEQVAQLVARRDATVPAPAWAELDS
ncbi:aldo/keto reductase [Nocardioides mangrovi]|uniref:Aldo/keto reductase n=1 Tax=Nocardioides mangrovi TaxID=2874580 RepID=A0ABS7UJY1_9ACTN|nr:aldo/keto reductase [Nocardioides mangrovi]MBZ5740976.1 aldo/keto reductase [Nocardioides mangrovi]